MDSEPESTNGGWLVLAGAGLLFLGAAFVLIQLANFYSMDLDLREQTEWSLCPASGPTGEGACTPPDAVPSTWPFCFAAVFVGVGALLLLLRAALDLRAHAAVLNQA